MTNSAEPFLICPLCDFSWPNRQSFLADPSTLLEGYHVNFDELDRGLLVFRHLCRACNTVFRIEVRKFLDLYRGPVHSERKTLQKECPGYCVCREQLAPCTVLCECAFVRAILQQIKNTPKNSPMKVQPDV